jgi:hypothetical protein
VFWDQKRKDAVNWAVCKRTSRVRTCVIELLIVMWELHQRISRSCTGVRRVIISSCVRDLAEVIRVLEF